MNKRHYEHTLPNIRGSLSNTYIPGVKIKTFYILFSFFFLIIFFFLHFVFLSVVFLCFCKCFRLADVEPTAVLKRITLYAGCFAHG